MEEILTNIGTIITNIVSWLGTIASYLITNPIFQIMIAVSIFTLIFYMLKNIISQREWRKKYANDDAKMREIEYNDIEDNGRW